MSILRSILCFSLLFLSSSLFFFSSCVKPVENENYKRKIYVRGVFDRSGPTSDVGLPYSQAILDAIQDSNESGGPSDHEIILEWEDIKNDPAKASSVYEQWRKGKTWATVVTIFGWNTQDTILLNQKVADDFMPYISASYAGILGSPKPIEKTVPMPPPEAPREIKSNGSPYNFFVGTDSSTAVRLALQYIKDSGGQEVAFFRCETQDCTDPLPAGKTYASELSLGLQKDLNLSLSETPEGIDSKVKQYFQDNPPQTPEKRWIWIGHTTQTASVIARSIAKYAPSAKIIVNVWGFDESLFQRCKAEGTAENPCIGRVFGLMPFAAYGDLNYPGMKDLVVLQNKQREKDKQDKTKYQNVRYVQGYVSFLVWKGAIQNLLKADKELSGYNIRTELEKLRNFSTGGLTPPLSFTPDDHRPTTEAFVYNFDNQGALQYQTQVKLERKSDWLGW